MRRFLLISILTLALPAWTRLVAQEARFKRGDANLDGAIDISDAVKALGILFLGDPASTCDDSRDMNDDGAIDISDAVYLLNFLFLGGAPPPPPFPECGFDASLDAQTCIDYPRCCVDEAYLDAAIEAGIPPTECIATNAAQISLGDLLITACPPELASPCPGPQDPPGCAVQLTVAVGTIDGAGSVVTIHLEGAMQDFPVSVENNLNPGDPTICRFHLTFAGDVLVPFEAAPDGTITDLLEPTLDREHAVVTLETPNTELICRLIEQQREQFIDELFTQLEAAARGLMQDVRADIVGSTLCETAR